MRISKNSSKVPMPPGRVRKAADRRAIRALRSCMPATTWSSVRPGVRQLLGGQRVGDDADDAPPCGQRRVGDDAHQPDPAAAVDQSQSLPGQLPPPPGVPPRCTTDASPAAIHRRCTREGGLAWLVEIQRSREDRIERLKGG